MKNLIIVCEEKYRQFGDYLAQLISSDDDTEDETVGTKDGEVAAQVWLEKDYLANMAQISSSQHILFIGDNKLIKEKSSHMNIEFSEFGMKYGWLGKQAVISVEKVVDTDKYDDFILYAQKNQQNVEKVLKDNEKKSLKNGITSSIANTITAGALAVFLPVAFVPVGIMTSKEITLINKIKEQQYSCAVMKFYLDDLSKFLDL